MYKIQKCIVKIILLVFIMTTLFQNIAFASSSKNNSKDEVDKKVVETVNSNKYNDTGIKKSKEKTDFERKLPTEKELLDKISDKKVKRELIIKYKDKSFDNTQKTENLNKVKSGLKLKKLKSKKNLKKSNIDLVEIDEEDNVLDVIEELKKDEDILYVQPNYSVDLLGIPEDEFFDQQWSLKNVGQDIQGKVGVEGIDINVFSAWEKTNGAEEIIVGVLDTGIDTFHDDLKDNIFVNEDEIPGNGIDDDGNSYVDDISGWDFYNDDNSINDLEGEEHGTAIAGLIAAKANDTGIHGTAPNVKLLPMKFVSGGKGYTFDILEAIEYAKKLNVSIINCSWGTENYNVALRNAMADSDILFLCSAGNNGDETAIYPAAYNLSNTVSIGSVDNSGNIASFSNYGGMVNVFAPGVDLISTKPQNDYSYYFGTSYSTALVTGVAALLKSYRPDLKAQDIAYTIKNNVKKQDADYGLVDATLAFDNILIYQAEDEQESVAQDVYANDEVEILGAGIETFLLEQLHYGVDGVNPATGNFSRSYVDMSMETVGPDIEIKRSYNSKDERSSVHFGRGWTFGYEGNVKYDSSNPLRVIVTLPGGGVETFLPYGEDGTYISDYSSGSRNILKKSSEDMFSLITKDQTVYEFNQRGWLSYIKDKNGNYIQITTSNSGRVQNIIDQTNRSFTVSYNSYNLIEKITDDTSGRFVSYQYNSLRLLNKVIDSMNNTIYTYGYDTEKFLESIKDADLKEIEKVVYDHSEGDKEDKVTKQTVYSTDTVYNTYTYDYYESARCTDITDLEGRKTTKWFDEQFNIVQSIDPEGKKTSAEYYISEGNIDWEVKTDDTGYGRTGFSTVSVDNVIYVIGGIEYIYESVPCKENQVFRYTHKVPLKNLEIYKTDMSRWTTRSAMPVVDNEEGRNNAAATYYNGDIYVAGGTSYVEKEGDYNSYGFFIPGGYSSYGLNSVVKYNVDSRSWSKIASMNHTRSNFSLVELGGIIYAIDEDGIEKYDSKNNKWVYTPIYGNSCSKAIAYNGKIYGRDNQYRLLEFNTVDNTWSVIASDAPEGWLAVRNNKLLTINESIGLIYEFDFEIKGWKPVASLEMSDMSAYSRYGGTVCNGNIYSFLCADHHYNGDDAYNYVIEGKWNDEVKINRYGDVKSITDRSGNKYQYGVDKRGNITKITNPDGSTREYTYDDKNNLLSEKDEENKYTFYQYDNDNINLVKEIQPLSSTINYVEGVNDSLFAITEYEYYPPENCNGFKGMLYKVIDPENNETTYTYNSKGYVETIKDAEGKKTTYGYNNIGWLTSETTGKGFVTRYEYDLNGNVVRMKLNGGETIRIVYDSMGRKVKEVPSELYNSALDGLNATPKNYTYSGNHGDRTVYYRSGLVSQQTDAENNITKYNYDKYGNVATEEKPDSNGVSSRRGAVYEYKYDNINRLKEVRYKESLTATAYKTLKKYDYLILEDGKTQTVQTTYLNDTQSAVVKTTYDFMNRELEVVNPDLTSDEKTYYKNGLLKTHRDEAGFVTYYNYDSMNRLTEIWKPIEVSGGKVKYSYSKKTYYKNSLVNEERVSKQKVEYPNKGTTYYVSKNNYYKNGKVKEKLQDGNTKLFYDYDADNNISCEKVYTSSTKYILTKYENNYFGKPDEKIQSVRKGDISGNTFSDNSLVNLVTKYIYDKNGNVKTITTPEQVKTTFGYDNLNRQTSVSYDDSFVDATGKTTTGTIKATKVYNYEGKPLKEIDANGNVTEYSYNKRGMLERITRKNVTIDGVKIDLVKASIYDLGGRVIAKVMPKYYDSTKAYTALNRTEFSYDLMDRVIAEKQVYMDTKTSTWLNYISQAYKYDEKGNVVKELDALGYEAGSGSTLEAKIETGYGKEYTYTPNNKVETVAHPVTIEDGLSYTTKYTYDTVGNLSSEMDARGVIKNYYYNNSGNLTDIKVKANASAVEKTIQHNTHDYLGNVITQTDGNGNKIIYAYNAFNKIRQVTYPTDSTIAKNVVIYQYDKDGNLKYQKDTFGTVDLYEYNKAGKVKVHTRKSLSGTDPVIKTTQEYDANGNVRKSVDGRKITTVYNYNELNKISSQSITVSGIIQTTRYKYDKNGNNTQTTDWRGNTSKTEYDQLNRVSRTVDAYNKTIERYEYNRNNAQIKAYDALNNMTEYKYDKNNRLIETIDPKLHSTIQEYDEVGNITAKTDGNGYTTTYEYDEFNRLEAVINPLLETTSYTYDLNGNMLTQTDGEGNKTDYRYNVVNKLIKTWNMGSSKVESYTYHPNGLMKTKKDKNGATTSYEYDCHGRLDKKSVGSLSVVYTYDGNGNQLTMTDGTGITERIYDELNRVKTKIVPKFGTTIYTYDITSGVDTGFIAEQSKDPKGNITTKVFDKAGRIKYVYDGTVTSSSKTQYNYYDNGNRKNVIYPNGFREDYTYYKDNLLWTLKNYKKSGSTDVVMDSYTYTYDKAHNQDTKVEVINGENKGKTSYTYDVLNRLKTVKEPNARTTSYQYDRAGNRKSEVVTLNGETTTTTYNYSKDNRLNSCIKKQGEEVIEKEIYGYDYNGNMNYKSKSTIQSYDVSEGETIGLYAETMGNSEVTVNYYDGFNQLVKTQIGDMNITYAYNGEGYRVEKKVNNSTTRYLYEYDKVVLETDGTGVQTGRNIYGTNLLMREAGNDTLYYMYNGHADVTALIDATTGVVRGSYYYDPFGNVLEQKYYTASSAETSQKINNSITYAGYQYDDETGLYYLNARMYDPKIARFLQEDTYRGSANDPLSLNLYTYCHNEPIMYTDPTGNTPIREVFDGIDTSVVWHPAEAETPAYASVNLNGLTFNFILDEHNNIELQAQDGTVLVDKIGNLLTFDPKNPNSKKAFMDINYLETLGSIGQYAVANDADNPVTAFAVLDPSFLEPLAPMKDADIKFRKDFYNTLVETGFDANNYDDKMIKAVFESLKEKDSSIKYVTGISTMLKTQQNYARHITWADMYASSLMWDMSRLSALQGVLGGIAMNKMANSFLYPNDPYSMKVNGKDYIPKDGSETAFKGTGKNGWNMDRGGGVINGRKYSEHSLERMAPDTVEVRAELHTRAVERANAAGLKPGTKEYSDFINKQIDPRGIPPSVVEDAIKNTSAVPGKYDGTFVHQNSNVTVIVNNAGDVVTVIPK